MGKLVHNLTILIFADLFFIITGQITGGFTSTIFNAMINLGNLGFSNFFLELIGNPLDFFNSGTGIGALFGTASVIIGGLLGSREFRLLLIPVFFVFGAMTFDFILLAQYLISLNVILGTLIMAPISILYVVVAVEWLVGKD